jgi:hypothetical protein
MTAFIPVFIYNKYNYYNKEEEKGKEKVGRGVPIVRVA